MGMVCFKGVKKGVAFSFFNSLINIKKEEREKTPAFCQLLFDETNDQI
jgi:hypothetical protein